MASVASAESNDPVYDKSLQTEFKTGDSQAEHQSCEQCEQEKPVKAFCVECQEFLCEECSIHHCRPRIMRHHRLLKENEIPRKKATKLVSENCVEHVDEVNKFYCERHNECCCSVCIATLHKSCEVKALSAITQNYLLSEEYDYAKKDFKLVNDLAQEQIKKIGKNIQASKTSVNVALEKLSKHRHDINKHFEELEKELKDEAMILQAEDLKQMHDLSQSCTAIVKDIEEIKDDLNVLEDTKQEKLLFAAVKMNKKRIEEMKDCLKQINSANKVRLVKYCKSRATKSLSARKDLLGFLQVFAVEKEENRVKEGEKEEVSKKVKEDGGNWKSKVEREQEKEMAQEKDYNFDYVVAKLYEYAVLPKILTVSEKATVMLEYYKSKISLYTVADKIEYANTVFLTGPWDMVEIETDMLAVTLPHEKKIKFLNLRNGIAEADEIQTPGFCKSISSDGNFLVVTFTEPAGLKILSKSGEVLRDIPMIEGGKTLFIAPSSAVVVHTNIFVTDPLMNTVTRMDSNGKIEKIVKHKDLVMPTSISYSNADESLYVSFPNGFKTLSMTNNLKKLEFESEDDLGFIAISAMINDNSVAILGFVEGENNAELQSKDSSSKRDDVGNSSDDVEDRPRESLRKSKKDCVIS
ncbi:uncharacterized protein LOC123531996 [Mercenaria mercenaria]|uniref:uncharacterized protein LOC123531996 n=1 Tax=Mercenaria mercenaria TaxID=6596 RepID=UPI00234EA7DA|nr:uncharacterized protein LOC123531996 [Mercenaria mercenaria]